MDGKTKHFIEAHFVGLFGILVFLLYLILNQLPEFIPKLAKYDLSLLDTILIVLGTGMVAYDCMLKQIDHIYSRFRYWLIRITDQLTPISIFFILIALTAIGFYLRFNDLGYRSFWTDEAITSYAAIGLLEHGAPVMPSGEVYTRALLNTYLIALSFKIFGISESSARIVSVIFGTLMIPLAYLLGKEFESKRVGIIAALLITFSAFEILWAREARMYAQFQFFYLLTAYLFYVSLKKTNSKLLLLSGISFIFAWYSHVLSLCFVPVAITYIIFHKRKEFLENKYFVYVSLAVMGLALVYMILTGKTPIDYYPSSAPKWGQHTVLHYAFSPKLFTLFVLASISGIVSLILWKFEMYKNKGYLYFIISFFIPFMILSASPWKTVRYAFFIFPFLVILASGAIDFYVIRNWGDGNRKVKSELVKSMKTVISITVILLVCIQVCSDIYFISHDSYNIYHDCPENWKKAGEFVKEHMGEDDKIATTLPLATLYYVGRVDYGIPGGFGDIDDAVTLTDRTTGAILFNDYNQFIQKINTEKGWVIADRCRLDGRRTDSKVREYIRNNMTYHPEGSDETVEVYSWGEDHK